MVTGESGGTTIITATSTFDSSKADSVEVTVTVATMDPAVDSVMVTPETATIEVGRTQQLEVVVEAQGGASTDVIWSTDNPGVATVDDMGLVSAESGGEATITATSAVDDSKLDNAEITVVMPPTITVEIDQESPELQVDSTITLTATVNSEGGAGGETGGIAWSTDNPSIADINASTGVVTGVSEGTATITATSTFDSSESDSVEVTVTAVPVEPEVIGVTVTPETVTIEVGQTQQLEVVVEVQGDASQDITWSNSNSDVATVDATGLVTAQAEGEVTITATSDFDESKSDSSTLTVITPPPMGTISGTLTAPTDSDLSGTSVTACFEGDCEDERSESISITVSSSSANYIIDVLEGETYTVIARKDVNGNNTADDGDLFGFYSASGTDPDLVTASATGTDFSLSVQGDNP